MARSLKEIDTAKEESTEPSKHHVKTAVDFAAEISDLDGQVHYCANKLIDELREISVPCEYIDKHNSLRNRRLNPDSVKSMRMNPDFARQVCGVLTAAGWQAYVQTWEESIPAPENHDRYHQLPIVTLSRVVLSLPQGAMGRIFDPPASW
jgi:hypothetical protein